jgi:hypothetical protein
MWCKIQDRFKLRYIELDNVDYLVVGGDDNFKIGMNGREIFFTFRSAKMAEYIKKCIIERTSATASMIVRLEAQEKGPV